MGRCIFFYILFGGNMLIQLTSFLGFISSRMLVLCYIIFKSHMLLSTWYSQTVFDLLKVSLSIMYVVGFRVHVFILLLAITDLDGYYYDCTGGMGWNQCSLGPGLLTPPHNGSILSPQLLVCSSFPLSLRTMFEILSGLVLMLLHFLWFP